MDIPFARCSRQKLFSFENFERQITLKVQNVVGWILLSRFLLKLSTRVPQKTISKQISPTHHASAWGFEGFEGIQKDFAILTTHCRFSLSPHFAGLCPETCGLSEKLQCENGQIKSKVLLDPFKLTHRLMRGGCTYFVLSVFLDFTFHTSVTLS